MYCLVWTFRERSQLAAHRVQKWKAVFMHPFNIRELFDFSFRVVVVRMDPCLSHRICHYSRFISCLRAAQLRRLLKFLPVVCAVQIFVFSDMYSNQYIPTVSEPVHFSRQTYLNKLLSWSCPGNICMFQITKSPQCLARLSQYIKYLFMVMNVDQSIYLQGCHHNLYHD